MKHKRYNFLGWHRLQEGTGEQTVLSLPGGVICDFQAAQVLKPLYVPCCSEMRMILDTGFRWVNFAPAGKNHALMVQLDAGGVPQQLYVDICDGHGTDPDGIPYVNDLYLDVIALCEVRPDGSWHVTETDIIDQDELDEALADGKITQAQYDLAWTEAKAVQAALQADAFAPTEVIRQYLTDPYT